MPELPEVETTRRGIAPQIEAQRLVCVQVRQPLLRWPVSPEILALKDQVVGAVARRGKYLLLHLESGGSLLLHLGMSGTLRLLPADHPPSRHDHLDLIFANGTCLRFNDPRRFGACLWAADWRTHPLLRSLGPEPLEPEFSDTYLFERSRTKRVPVKQFIMNSQVVVGVGNIYANESLFLAGIHPGTLAGKLSRIRYARLSEAIRTVLQQAITQGGTTLKDFVNSDGKPGYFSQELQVYGRAGQPCKRCNQPLKETRQGQRTTVYCPKCQR